MKHSLLCPVVIAAVLGLTSCSEPAKTPSAETEVKKEPAGPPQPVTAKTAFWEVYKPARAWAVDVQPINLTSGEVKGVKNEDGKAGLWTISVVSPSLRQARTYFYAVADDMPNVAKGIKLGATVPWGGPTAHAMPIQLSDFSTDSDAAYKSAYAKAADWVKKHPEKEATLTIGNASRFPAPTWYVLWGNEKSGYEVFVNATTGAISK